MRFSRRGWGLGAALLAGFASLAVSPPPPSAAQAAPTITADPATDLVDGDAVTVTVTGLAANAQVVLGQCRAGAASYWMGCQDQTELQADASGALTQVFKVDAVIRTYDDDEQIVTTDCRTDDCVLGLAEQFGEGMLGDAPLAFTADGALAPAPVLQVEPHDDLSDLQQVTVTGSGFVWSRRATLLECPTGFTAYYDCASLYSEWVEVSETGEFELSYAASALLESYDADPVDCREPDACVLVAFQDGRDLTAKSATAPLGFDPGTEIVTPTVEADPDNDLVDGQTVTVTGSGFALPSWLSIYTCPPEAAGEGCLWLEEVEPEGDSFEIDVAVSALFVGEDGTEVDCRAADEPCQLVVAPSGSLTSPRAGRVDLHFDPDGSVLPGPQVSVQPATDLPPEATITVSGIDFSPQSSVDLKFCSAADHNACDSAAQGWTLADSAGQFTTDMAVAAEFTTDDGVEVDCRAAPGCEVLAHDWGKRRNGVGPVTFAAAPPPGTERYVDPIFDEVEVTEDVVYRETTDHRGRPVELKLDIYQPAGDDVAKRPAVVWMHGGWFSNGGKEDMAGYARAFARRGYVAVSVEYRLRDDFSCCSTFSPLNDAEALTDALMDAYDDGAAALDWLRQNSGDYRIDPDAIAAGGAGAGAATSWHLAELPGQMGVGGTSSVAAALPIAGANLGKPDSGEAPVLAFHARGDNVSPAHMSEHTCARATSVGTRCEVVVYDGGGEQVARSRQRDIVNRSVDFLADAMLASRGYVSRPGHPTTAPPTSATSTTSTTAASGGHSGSLPRTGVDTTLLLIRIGLILIAAGGVIVTLARRKGKKTERAIVVVMAITVAAIGAAFVASSEDEPKSLAAPVSDEHADHDDHDADEHEDDEDHDADEHDDDMDSSTHDDGTHDDGTHDDDDGHTHDGTGTGGTGAGHGHGSGGDHTHDDDMPGGHSDGDHPHPEDPNAPPHEHPPGEPPHPHPTTPGEPPHTHPTQPPVPDPGFPTDWTAEQRATAQELIDDTTAALEPMENRALLPLMGYQWIFDGQQPENYQHWISIGRIIDQRPPLTVVAPESLVWRNDTEDGPVLEAAMYMLGLDHMSFPDPLGKVPADIKWLPDWHVHENLCFGPNYTLLGVAKKVDGEWTCDPAHGGPGGGILPTPPMLHVWTVPTVCGRFAGVDEEGLRCDGHPHDH